MPDRHPANHLATEPHPFPPVAVDYRTRPPALTRTVQAWRTWREEDPSWEGRRYCTSLDAAKAHAAADYIGSEYSWYPGDDPDDEAPQTVLTWTERYGRWCLLENGLDTGVRIAQSIVWGPA